MIRYLTAACSLVAGTVSADVGIGVSVKSGDTAIYVPVEAGRFMFEPYVRYADGETTDFETASFPSPPMPPNQSEGHSYVVGVGIFRTLRPAERVTVYYGGRIGAISEQSESTNYLTPTFSVRSVIDVDGSTIAPTAGLQYGITERLSIGAEIGFERSEVEGTLVSQSFGAPSMTGFETTRNDTRSNLIVRFFF